MTSSYEQPSFIKEVIDLERRRIALVDQLLADNGALMLDDLFQDHRKKPTEACSPRW